MALRKLSGLLFATLFSSTLLAETIQVNPAHPDQYTVVEGDTLWDISGKFLQHPWQWPELWRYNSQIQNPNLIYPGDNIRFSVINGVPQLSISRSEQFIETPAGHGPCVLLESDYKNGRKNFAVSEDGKVLPCIREVPMKQAIELIPAGQIRAFLSSPKVVGANELNESPYVIDLAGEHLIAGAGDRIYVRPALSGESHSYTVYRPGMPYINPDTKEVLGYEATYVADATLQEAGDPTTLGIEKSSGEIRKGDRLMPSNEEEIALHYFPRPPENKINGNIVSVLGGVSQIGKFDVVVVDKGKKDGLLPGHELEIHRKGKLLIDPYSKIKNDTVKLPDEHAGLLMVFRPFERVSYALVMKASQAIHVLDKVQSPEQ